MTKLSKIKRIKNRIYSPASDYYKPLREAIIEVTSSGDDANNIFATIQSAHHTRQENYTKICENFIHWITTKNGWAWQTPPRGYYGDSTIGVRVNPELAFVDKFGGLHIVKLHFNQDSLSRGRLDVAGCLFFQSLAPKCPESTKFYFLDLHQPKLFSVKQTDNADVFLDAELQYIKSIWSMA